MEPGRVTQFIDLFTSSSYKTSRSGLVSRDMSRSQRCRPDSGRSNLKRAGWRPVIVDSPCSVSHPIEQQPRCPLWNVIQRRPIEVGTSVAPWIAWIIWCLFLAVVTAVTADKSFHKGGRLGRKIPKSLPGADLRSQTVTHRSWSPIEPDFRARFRQRRTGRKCAQQTLYRLFGFVFAPCRNKMGAAGLGYSA
jgi:hypothetical protein